MMPRWQIQDIPFLLQTNEGPKQHQTSVQRPPGLAEVIKSETQLKARQENPA